MPGRTVGLNCDNVLRLTSLIYFLSGVSIFRLKKELGKSIQCDPALFIFQVKKLKSAEAGQALHCVRIFLVKMQQSVLNNIDLKIFLLKLLKLFRRKRKYMFDFFRQRSSSTAHCSIFLVKMQYSVFNNIDLTRKCCQNILEYSA